MAMPASRPACSAPEAPDTQVTTDGSDFLLLRIAQLKGMASAEMLQAASTPDADVAERIGALVGAGLLQQLPRGLRVTPAGREWLAACLAREAQAVDREATRRVYDAFDPVNRDFKQLIYAWQMRSDGGTPVPNDHQDAAYDAALVARLHGLQTAVLPVLAAAAAMVARLVPYRARLAAALARIDAGERRYVAAPLIDSYHTIWFELHEDLLAVAGLSRTEEARAGRAD